MKKTNSGFLLIENIKLRFSKKLINYEYVTELTFKSEGFWSFSLQCMPQRRWRQLSFLLDMLSLRPQKM